MESASISKPVLARLHPSWMPLVDPCSIMGMVVLARPSAWSGFHNPRRQIIAAVQTRKPRSHPTGSNLNKSCGLNSKPAVNEGGRC